MASENDDDPLSLGSGDEEPTLSCLSKLTDCSYRD